MPQLAAFLPLIFAAVGGVEAGRAISGAVSGGGAKPGPAVPTVTPEAAAKTKQNQEASLSQAFPGIQAATGGSLSPEAWIRLSELLTQQSGAPGIDAAGQDLIKKFSSGLTSGGPYG